MSDIPSQTPPQEKITVNYVYALDQRIRELEQQNNQLEELLKQAESKFKQVSNVLEAQDLQVQEKFSDLKTNLIGQLDEFGRQGNQTLIELTNQAEILDRERLPVTMLLSNNFFMRALTIYGYILVIGLVVGLFFTCLSGIVSTVGGISMETRSIISRP